jgi:aminoglycoside 2'-N-acetyltransferase I
MSSPLTILVANTEALTEALRADIITVCIDAHSEPEFAHLFTWVPTGGLHVVAQRDGRVLGHAMVTARRAQPAGLPELNTAYVDAVSVSPQQQGSGVGSAVMRALAQEITSFDIACLETNRPGFYERLGWQIWRGPKAGRGPAGLIMTPAQQTVMILQLDHTPPLELDSLLTIECQPGRIW